MKIRKGIISLLVTAAMLLGVMPSAFAAASAEVTIVLSDNAIQVNGSTVTNDETQAVYTANDIVYYEEKETYSDTGYAYGAGTATEKHSAAEAAAHTVVHITKAGTYRVSGTLSKGQIWIDLGDDAETDPNAVVNLILDGVSITCTVAPAVVFHSVYECDANELTDDDTERAAAATSDVDTAAAGANVILADGTTNTVNGSYVAKIYKNKGENGVSTEKKLWKQDGAFYSYMSMNLTGEAADSGILNIIAANEGLDSEHHLTINGGNINITAQNDGINTNDDKVSVTTINGGSLHIVAGLGAEGDGIDSNGWLVINGGTVISMANPASDSGLDADMGSYVNGGTVVALGSTMDWAESDSAQVTVNLQFASYQSADEAIVLTKQDGTVVFAYDADQDETAGVNARKYMGAVLSSPALEVGETYLVYVGGDVTGTEVQGVYDASTVTAFDGGKKQVYTGTDVGRIFGGAGGDKGEPPDHGDVTENADGTITLPDGTTIDPSQMQHPENGERPSRPTAPEGGMTPPDGGFGPGGPGQSQTGTTSTTSSVYFYMTDQVNAFSGVTDYTDMAFTDLSSDSTYYEAIQYVRDHGLMGGVSTTSFEPDSGMTRAMFITVLYRQAGSPSVTGTSGFTDVTDSTQYYYNAVLWAEQNGIAQGYSDGTFGTSSELTREELVTILYRYIGEYKKEDVSSHVSLASYTDAASVSDYAAAAVNWAVSNGVIKGTTDARLLPQHSATRAQCAQILMNLFA